MEDSAEKGMVGSHASTEPVYTFNHIFICENILTTFSLPDIKLLQLTLHPQQTEICISKMVLDH